MYMYACMYLYVCVCIQLHVSLCTYSYSFYSFFILHFPFHTSVLFYTSCLSLLLYPFLRLTNHIYSFILFFSSTLLCILLGNSGPSSQITTSLSIVNNSTLANSERGPGIAMNQNNRNGANNGMFLLLLLSSFLLLLCFP